MGENRIIKIMIEEGLNGASTVFHQFAGKFGPSAIFAFNECYYVALYEFEGLASEGEVNVLSEYGALLERYKLPMGPEITGLFIHESD